MAFEKKKKNANEKCIYKVLFTYTLKKQISYSINQAKLRNGSAKS